MTDTDYRYVFFNCREYETLDDEIKGIVDRDTDKHKSIERYKGRCKASPYIDIELNPDNIKKEENGEYSIINPDNLLTPQSWLSIKYVNKMERNVPQTEQKLTEMGYLPITKIRKIEPITNKKIWNSAELKYPSSFCNEKGYEQFMGYMIDNTKGRLAGVVKASVQNSLSCPEIQAIKDIPKEEENYIYISDVNIHPDYMGKKLCKSFLKWFMSNFPEYKFFYIYNTSLTNAGIPACFCYVKAGLEEGYKMYYTTEKSVTSREVKSHGVMTIDECTYSEANPFEMPKSYIYVKYSRSMNGSGKTHKKTHKKTRRKRKFKSRKNKKKNKK